MSASRLVLHAFVLLSATALAAPPSASAKWWQKEVMYQIYPRSFQDSNGDGTGDLKGIEQRLPYLKELGVGFIWLSPVMKSPMLDFGYDIADFMDVDPIFGTLQDMRELIAAAEKLGIKLLMDFVPNHSSNSSKWFKESRSSKTNPKRDWYVWHPGKTLPDGTRAPPNNWASNFGGPLGSSWTWDEQTQEYYYHAFGEFQPDLNYHNPEVVKAMQDVLRFWMKMGIGGFRIDAVPFLLEDPKLQDEPVNLECAKTSPIWNCMQHIHTQNDPKNHEIIRGWRSTIDEFEDRVMFGEIYAQLPDVMSYYGTPDKPEFNVPFNFEVLGQNYGEPNDLTNATVIRDAIRAYSDALNGNGKWCHGNWVLGNHDNHRVMDRVGNNSALTTTVYTLLNLLPGTPTIYNGDELAMRDLYIPYDKCQDPMCKKNPKMFAKTGRDPERTPFQWDASPEAGFSTSQHTWLPINPDHVTFNVETEKKDTASPVSITMRTLRFRGQNPDISLGQVTHVPELLADVRDHLVVVQYSTETGVSVTVANWNTKGDITFNLAALLSGDALSSSSKKWQYRFSTDGSPVSVDLQRIRLRPGEVAVLAPVLTTAEVIV